MTKEKVSIFANDNLKYGLSVAVFVLVLFFIKLAFIWFELVDTERGDASVYFYKGAINKTPYFSSMAPWLNIHPPLPEILSGLLFSIYKSNVVMPAVSFVQLSLIVLTGIYAISSGVFYATVKQLFNPYAAYTGTLFFASAGLLQIVTLNGNAEAFALLFFMLSIYYFSIYMVRYEAYRTLFMSGVLLILASLCRTEVLILIPILCLILLLKKGLRISVTFGLLTSAFELMKIAAKLWLFKGQVIGYENMEQKWHVTEKTFDYVVSESPTSLYIYTSYNAYFFFAIIFAAIFLIFNWKNSIALVSFLTFSFFIGYFQFVGRIPNLERYGFFQVICFAFVITSVYSKVYSFRLVGLRLTALIFVISLVAASFNFYSAMVDRASRSPQEIVDTRKWLTNHTAPEDSIFIDFMFYWSWNLRQHLAAELKAREPNYFPRIYDYSYGMDSSWTERDLGSELDWRDLDVETTAYYKDVLRTPIFPSNSISYRVKQRLLAEIFIATKRPKYFVIPINSSGISPHISKSFIRNKLIPLSGDAKFVNLEYFKMDIQLEPVHSNDGVTVFLAHYSNLKTKKTLFKGRFKDKVLDIPINELNSVFVEIGLKADQCVKPLIIKRKGKDGLFTTFSYYHMSRGVNTLPLTEDYLSPGKIKQTKSNFLGLEFQAVLESERVLDECVDIISVFSLTDQ